MRANEGPTYTLKGIIEGPHSLLRTSQTEDQIRVYSNAFTFNAVPSACLVAGFGTEDALHEQLQALNPKL